MICIYDSKHAGSLTYARPSLSPLRPPYCAMCLANEALDTILNSPYFPDLPITGPCPTVAEWLLISVEVVVTKPPSERVTGNDAPG